MGDDVRLRLISEVARAVWSSCCCAGHPRLGVKHSCVAKGESEHLDVLPGEPGPFVEFGCLGRISRRSRPHTQTDQATFTSPRSRPHIQHKRSSGPPHERSSGSPHERSSGPPARVRRTREEARARPTREAAWVRQLESATREKIETRRSRLQEKLETGTKEKVETVKSAFWFS
jgi:hypothetical protein